MISPARQYLNRSGQARENGNFVEALKLTDEAIIAYQKEGDLLGAAEIQSSRSLIFRHLYEETQDENYLIVAKHASLAGVEIAQKSANKTALAIPLFNLAKIQEQLNEPAACNTYQEALDNLTNNPPEEHNRAGVVADFKIHLYACLGNVGEVEKSIEELEASDETKYNKDVWLSGAHMKIAKILQTNDPEKAKEHLQKAKEIIDANPDLALRLKQWEKLAQAFS